MTSSTSNSGSTGDIPFILQGKYYDVVTMDKKTGKVSAICVECRNSNKTKIIHGSIHPTSNFVSHLKVGHSTVHERYQVEMKEPGRKLKVVKQSVLNFQRTVTPSKVLQSEKLIVNYLIDSIIPLSTVDNPAFKALVYGLGDGASVPSRKRLRQLILERYHVEVKHLMAKLQSADFLCVTADIWSSRHRSFFGATVHWINGEMQRESSVLVLSRFSGTHDYEKITEVLLSTFEKFEIPTDKITCVVTDNGSNFVKAFKENGIVIQDQQEDEENDDVVDLDLVEFPDTSPALPRHERCASHTLSLIATTDLDNANIVTPRGPDNFKRIFRGTLAKCSAIWNASGRSVKVAEQLQELLGKSLIQPNSTRWNSMFDAIRRLLEFKEKITEICNIANVQMFTSTELDLLDEYMQALQPVAFALDKLQADKSFYFGYKIPVLLQTRKKLVEVIAAKQKFGTHIAKALIAGLEKRFRPELALDVNECSSAIFAAISSPFLKLRWIPSEQKEALKAAFMNEAKLIGLQRKNTNHDLRKKSIPPEDNFFQFEPEEGEDQDLVNTMELECFQYFKDPSMDLGSLDSYPTIRQVFVKYNTALASSAAVERMFSYGGMILSPKRACLSDEMLNMLVFLKVKY